MSEFDKEAEREKLRERFERDKQKRQATERMSELLLKGATMTNKHCQQCGDPVFRQDGEEFCPSCGTDAATQAEGQQPPEAPEAPEAPEQPMQDAQASEQTQPPEPPEPPASEPTQGQPTPEPPVPEGRTPDNEDDLAAARASLARTLTRMAERAEHADDPRSAKAYLEAAKEAAETLDALR